ncbi:MAG TPA: hypothetical protein VJ998_08850 [Pseudomonadales bacterium]|nr:hypothetical protein [Pseudomonadales bacterium]
MWKVAIAVVVGFVVWSVLWVGGNQILGRVSPGMFNPVEGHMPPIDALVILLIFSMVCSLASGLATGYMVRPTLTPVWVLAGILLLVGVMVEAGYWTLLPLWYHVAFLVLLVPVTAAGGLIAQMRASP